MSHRQEKIESLLTQLAGTFLSHEAGPKSLITVTRVAYNEKTNHAVVCISVLPENREEDALAFAKRRSSDLRNFVKEHIKMRAVPVFDFLIDLGEKNRQRVDDILTTDNVQVSDKKVQ